VKNQNEHASPTPSSDNDSVKELGGDSVDRFSIIVYGLVTVAMLAQVGWILWLEYI
tara:strand:+ start:324 stop:491 length:168 start_codon:yes stop_codon:yes gene_type:complete